MTTSTKPTKRLHITHTSMQFSDTGIQKAQDAEKIFARAERRGVAVQAGTEGWELDAYEALHEAARDHGYRFHMPRTQDSWIAVRKDRIAPGSYAPNYSGTLIDGQHGRFTNKGLPWVTFVDTQGLGTITHAACHFLTKGDPTAKDPARRVNVKENQILANAAGHLARRMGRGNRLFFASWDANINDREGDTALGNPLTSVADELDHWVSTGHGPIDAVLSYDADGRVKAAYGRALSDADFSLHTDHYQYEAGFDVRAL